MNRKYRLEIAGDVSSLFSGVWSLIAATRSLFGSASRWDFVSLVALGLVSATTLTFIVFRRKPTLIVDPSTNLPVGKQFSYPRARRLALTMLFVTSIASVVGGVKYVLSQQDEFLVLVADFDRSDTDRNVELAIVSNVAAALRGFPDIKVRHIDQKITIAEGTDIAREIGKARNASLVIWGSYGAPNNDLIPASVHIEVLRSEFPSSRLSARAAGQLFVIPLEAMESYEFHTNISDDVARLSLFVVGFTILERQIETFAGDQWDYLADIFSEVLNNNKASEPTLFDRGHVFALRGMVNSFASRHQQAMVDFDSALTLDSADALAYNYRALYHLLNGHGNRAVSDLNRLIQLRPQSAVAHTQRALASFLSGDLDGAFHDLDIALSIEPTMSAALSYRALFHAWCGSPEEAAESIRLATRMAHPSFLDGLQLNLATMKIISGDIAQGMAELERLKLHDGLKNIANQSMAIGHFLTGDLDAALSTVNKVTSSASPSSRSYVLRAVINAALDSLDDALADTRAASSLDPQEWTAYLVEAAILATVDNTPMAISAFERAMAVDGDNPMVNARFALYLAQLGQIDRGIGHLDRALTTTAYAGCRYSAGRPTLLKVRGTSATLEFSMLPVVGNAMFLSRSDLFALRAHLKLALSSATEAEADIDSALALDPEHELSYVMSAMAAMQRGNIPVAMAHVNRAIALDSTTAFLYYMRSGIRESTGLRQMAIYDLDKAIAIDSSMAIAYLARARLYAQSHLPDRAAVDLATGTTLSSWPQDVFLTRAVISFTSGEFERSLMQIDSLLALPTAGAAEGLPRATNKWRRANQVALEAKQCLSTSRLRCAVEAAGRAFEFDTAFSRSVRSEAMLRAGAITEAEAEANRSLTYNHRDPRPWAIRAWAKAMRGDPRGAQNDASQSLLIDPTFSTAHAVYVFTAWLQGECNAVLDRTELRQPIEGEIFPRSYTWLSVALCHEYQGDSALALTTYHAARDLDSALAAITPDTNLHVYRHQMAELWISRGDSLAASTLLDSATSWYERGRRFDEHVEVHVAHGLCRYGTLLGQAREYIVNCDRALELSPNESKYRESRAIARAALGNFAGAIQDLRVAVDSAEQPDLAAMRTGWIETLEQGANPFIPKLMRQLLRQPLTAPR